MASNSKDNGENTQEEAEIVPPKRESKLTVKALAAFEETCTKYRTPIFQSWRRIEDSILQIPKSEKNIEHLRKLDSELSSARSEFCKCNEDYLAYLQRFNNEIAKSEAKRCSEDLDKGKAVILKALNNIKSVKLELLDSVSNISLTSSERKRKDERKLELMKREAELKKEKLRLEVTESIQKAELKRKKEELDIDLNLLKQESILEANCDEEEACFDQSFRLDVETSSQRASRYVSSLPDVSNNHPEVSVCNDQFVGSDSKLTLPDMTLFLLRKQLIPERFSNFDDTPESYTTWKSSFKSIVHELKASKMEEIELLLNRLSGNSKLTASGVRNANPGQPERALQLIWDRLDQMYGRPKMVEASIRQQLENFRPVSCGENKRLYDLMNILIKIESLMTNSAFSTSLAYFNSSTGVNPIITKLPFNIQEKWINRASGYKKANNVPFPPFTFFVTFVREICEIRNDPAFSFPVSRQPKKAQVQAKKLDVTKSDNTSQIRCPYHKANHSIHDCKAFSGMSIAERKNFLINKHICTRCCVSTKHSAKDCQVKIWCKTCGSNNHATALHWDKVSSASANVHGGEGISNSLSDSSNSVTSKCTTFCGDTFQGRSCSKTFLVDIFHDDYPNNVLRTYAIVDDQCNQTLASPELLDSLNMASVPSQFTLTTCSGKTSMYGRNVQGLKVRSIDKMVTLDLPLVLECEDIPNDVSEIPTPEVAKSYPHLSVLAPKIPKLDPNLKILLLIGRDLLEAHHIEEQILGPRGTPFAQKLAFGWAIIGEVCLGKIHQRSSLNVKKVSILNNGRVTCNELCPNYMQVKEQISSSYKTENCDFQFRGNDVFLRTSEDDRIGLSVEDRLFLQLMDKTFSKNSEGLWTAPLPFRQPPVNLPNNRSYALHRAQLLHNSLQRDSVKKEQFVQFMNKVLESGAAEVAPDSTTVGWYLPLFGVRNPKKPNQIRGVFDSSAKYGGVSLNSMLMTGPDMINSLLGILLRFRKDEVAMTADIELMFYRFRVDENHRDFLRFFWYRNNNPEDILIEYRMTSHVFGNSPSPAVASYGLLKTVENAESDVKDFVHQNFYVDDGLISLPSESAAIQLMKRTQYVMKTEGQIRLHKITSNKAAVMEAFDVSDRGENVKEIDDEHLVHQSLGLCWNLKDDTFVFKVPQDEKPFTRRGLLSTVNSLFDPIGFIAPITVTGKILLRECTPEGIDWDQPLPTEHLHRWKEWQSSLHCLSDIAIPRMLSHTSVTLAKVTEVHIFSDASEKAIAASAYLKTVDSNGFSTVRFLMGKGKLAPLKGITVPRLELCATVLATELAEIISVQLNIPLSTMKFYTDSRVVLGYINNRTRRFYTYVSNRVERILRISSADQWNFISSEKNPADSCTRCVTSVIDIMKLQWFIGPQWLCNNSEPEMAPTQYPLIYPENDQDVRPLETIAATCFHTAVAVTSSQPRLGIERFERFSKWSNLITGIVGLQRICRKWKARHNKPPEPKTISHADEIRIAETFVLKQVQEESFSKDVKNLMARSPLTKDSNIATLSPFLDDKGLLRVGGRINKATGILPAKEINPIILPKNGHVSLLLIRRIHDQVKHQGRLFTEGALRTGGYWIIGAKRMIASMIHKCVTCRKLRRCLESQKMADVPIDRITPGPAFTSVGIDVFGPWEVSTRKTRGGAANSKRWGLMFTCLTSRAVHIEVLEQMTSSSFINALRRFMAVRGPVKFIRSDRGSNFIGAAEEMKINTVKVEEESVQQFLDKSGITWIFNVPHSSHMGGIWERMIGITRKILDSILLESNTKNLTHETLVTFLCEVSAIINSRPITPISSDPEEPLILTPSILLTGKVEFLPVMSDSLKLQDVYRSQWKRVQILADIFWQQWRKHYLNNLQNRRKWNSERRNLKVDDVVLLRDPAEHRNCWPVGIIDRVFNSDDDLVRKVVVRIIRGNKPTFYIRPVHELVLLIESQ